MPFSKKSAPRKGGVPRCDPLAIVRQHQMQGLVEQLDAASGELGLLAPLENTSSRTIPEKLLEPVVAVIERAADFLHELRTKETQP
jgi:hypothetical protein